MEAVELIMRGVTLLFLKEREKKEKLRTFFRSRRRLMERQAQQIAEIEYVKKMLQKPCNACGKPMIFLKWYGDILGIYLCNTNGCKMLARPQGFVKRENAR